MEDSRCSGSTGNPPVFAPADCQCCVRFLVERKLEVYFSGSVLNLLLIDGKAATQLDGGDSEIWAIAGLVTRICQLEFQVAAWTGTVDSLG